jgi:TetR/AcrR family transcriptional regulator, transcriptional repressor for nem operon
MSDMATRIREAAHDLLATYGYSGFSFADVSEIVGIRKPSIHHHYPTKVDLVVAVLRAHRSSVAHAITDLEQQVVDPLQRLQLYVDFWEGCMREQRRPICIAALLSAEAPGLPDAVKAEVKQHFDFFTRWVRNTLQEASEKGTIHLHARLKEEAQNFVALVHGAMLSARIYASPEVFRSITATALQQITASN